MEASAQSALRFYEVHGKPLLAQELGSIQAAYPTAYHQYIKVHTTKF